MSIADEPARGVDVGAKAAIHGLIDELDEQGTAIMLISPEPSEIINLPTRAFVIRQGRIAGELPRKETSPDAT